MKPDAVGTKISDKTVHHPDRAKAITALNHLSLITVQGKGMQGTFSLAAKTFTALATESIGVLFVCQASSENNISLATRQIDAARAVKALKDTFTPELKLMNVEMVYEEPEVSIIAVVGEGMRNHRGIAGRIFTAVGKADINIIAIAQGSSERNISFIVKQKNAARTMQSIHDELGMENSPKTTLKH